MLRLYASDPLFAEWDELLTLYAQMLNPACFVNLCDVDTEAAEYKADVITWREHVTQMFEELTR